MRVEEREERINKLRKAIILIEEYTLILRNLISNHRVDRNLAKLQKIHEREISNWAEQVNTILKQMDNLLAGLDHDVKNVKKVLADEPININKLQVAVADISHGMYISGLHDEEEHLIRLRDIDIFKIHELKKIINHEQHHKGLLKWIGFANLTPHEKEIEHEKYFANLLSR
ncbi:MAG: hypothetical protein KKE98_02030 [Nanoarchaeota archaeon]|nr:hypothetical protein [Nanoarchaeota archaeon]MBU1597199.1 hypothetical protein [Nanoarchaeota archaeon]MBU2441898.1 hypothetical protein [Nanoarchaeota archaeon]